MNYASAAGARANTAPIVAEPLCLRVADRLRAWIYDRRLATGAWIDELALARELGVSRTPLREALRILERDGLVRNVPRHGSFVAELSLAELDALLPVMALLEGRCTYEAVRKASDADIAALSTLHAELERRAERGEREAYEAVNYDFQARLEALAGNPWLQRVASELRRLLRLLRSHQLELPGRFAAPLAQHRALMRAIRARDAVGAERIMKRHLRAQHKALWRTAHSGTPSRGGIRV